MKRIYDVSAPLRNGAVVYPGNPEISIASHQAVSTGASASVSRLSLGSHSGTHVDAARHFFDSGQPVDKLPLGQMMGPARLVRFPDSVRAIGADDLRSAGIEGASRVLLATRNSALLRESPEFHEDYTYLAPDGAAYLVEQGVRLVGIDYLSIEQFHSGHHRTHRTLLGADVVIVEGLDLSEPPGGEYTFICLPLRIENGDGAPARALLIDDNGESLR